MNTTFTTKLRSLAKTSPGLTPQVDDDADAIASSGKGALMRSSFQKRLGAVFCYLCLSAPLFLPLHVSAEDNYKAGQIGRTRDGKPYRVDGQGLRLTDQLAELEVTIAELRRDNMSLEDELVEKDALIAKLSSGRGAATKRNRDSTVEEEDLLSDQSPKRTHNAGGEDVESLRNSRALLEKQLGQVMNDFKACQADRAEGEKQSHKVLVLQSKVDLLNGENENLRKELDSKSNEMAVLAKTQNSLKQIKPRESLATLKTESGQPKSGDLPVDVASSSDSSGTEHSKMANLQSKTSTQASAARARVNQAVEETSQTVPAFDSQSGKSRLNTLLKEVQNMIVVRKSLYDTLKGTSRGVSIQLRTLQSRSGESLDRLRSMSAKVSSSDEVEFAATGILEVKRILDEDIATLKRLTGAK